MSDLLRLSAQEAARRIAAGKLTAEALVGACLARIAEREPKVAAWQHLDPERALAEARARDRETPRGPLHGVPVAVKDIMDTADQPTGYGSRGYEGHRPDADAACVTLARAAGAIVLGKTVSTEFAAMSPGKTRNPHDPGRTPGGSSSGSAAAVGDHMLPLAFGTQTAGSIIRPAAFCGIVGYKPSFGLVATAGTKALAPGLDTIGGFARSVGDIALLIAAITNRPSLRPTAPAIAPRVGLYRPPGSEQAEPTTHENLARAAERLRRAKFTVTERAAFAPFDRMVGAQEIIMLYEAAANLAWERLHLADKITAQTLRMLEDGAAIPAETYDSARATGASGRAAAADFFGDVDAVLVPSAPGEAPQGIATGDPVFNRMWTLLHLPCVTLPFGRGPAGLPLGVQLVGRAGQDAQLLSIAQSVEAALADIG